MKRAKMTARDRMGYLFEEGTFSEIGMHVRHNCHNFGMGKKEIPGDGVVSGFGLVDGRTRTLEEVGKEFNVTRERIRQIEAKALRKLRHPSRSKKLRDFLN